MPFERFKKHEKKISRWLDFIVVAIILLGAIFYGFLICGIYLTDRSIDIPPEYRQTNTSLHLSINFLLLSVYSTWAIIMASLLSFFHKNLTIKKRIILIAMCLIPLFLWLMYFLFDSHQDNSHAFKFLYGILFSLTFINGPPIILGKPFAEFFSRLFSKIPFFPNMIDEQAKHE